MLRVMTTHRDSQAIPVAPSSILKVEAIRGGFQVQLDNAPIFFSRGRNEALAALQCINKGVGRYAHRRKTYIVTVLGNDENSAVVLKLEGYKTRRFHTLVKPEAVQPTRSSPQLPPNP